jgi:uncharacterized repeat protein (TIGR01451 family)
MKRKGLQILLALTLGLVTALALLWRLEGKPDLSLAQAGTGAVHVATTGSDTPDCGSKTAPCATVQHAVDLAHAGDVVKVASGVYTGVNAYGGITQVVYLSKSLTLRGGYTTPGWSVYLPISHPTTLDAQGQGRVLYVSGEVTVTIEGLRITGGDASGMAGHAEPWYKTEDAGGGVYAVSATLTLKDNQVFSNTAYHGAGVYVANSEALLVGNQVFSNTAGQDGGGIYVINAVGEYDQPISNTATLIGNQVFDNRAGQDGGGVYVSNSANEYGEEGTPISATLTMAGNLVSGNVAGGSGGGVYTNKTIDEFGMGYLINATTTISDNQVRHNLAHQCGGGLSLHNSAATLSKNTIAGNHASRDGGGLCLTRFLFGASIGAPTLDENTLSANHAYSNGGGLYMGFAHVTFNGNRVISNSADYGGGLYLYHSGGTFNNTAITDNQAERAGSGVLYEGSSWSQWFHTTVARNGSTDLTAGHGGDGRGILVNWYPIDSIILPGWLAMTNTLIASQTVGITVSEAITELPDAVTLDGVLWYGNGANTGGTGVITITHAYTGNPAFAPDGYHLTAASAAIDGGVESEVLTDLDGEARPNGVGYDVGADEFWGPVLEVAKHAHPTVVQAGARLTYTLVVTNHGVLDLRVTVTDTLPPQVQTNEGLAGTVVLSGGELVWRPVVSAGGAWTQQVVVTVALQYEGETLKVGYAGPLTNVVWVTGPGGLVVSATCTTQAVLEYPKLYLPLVMGNYPRYENRLINPGFEGIGLPLDNDAPNPNNYTQDTFNGEVYGEIFTPEGWVTWWEESDVYRRPEAHVVPKEPPYTYDPVRIYQGYYAAMYFTFHGQHNAGYYQQVNDLPPGAWVTFYAHAHAWSCENDDIPNYSCGNPENHGFRVGIDPDGGTDPWSPNVSWSERVSAPDVFREIGPVRARVGSEGSVTVFLRSDVQWWPYKHSDSYWDNAALMVPVY